MKKENERTTAEAQTADEKAAAGAAAQKKIVHRTNLRTALRMSIGIIVSVLIAQMIGLEFAASTCIVTMLGIQATKRDTLRTAGARIVSIAYTICIALAVYWLIGSGIVEFCIAVVILALITYLLGWTSTLSINVVVLVHMFLQQVPFTADLVLNEIMRVMVGLVIALIINWRLPTRENEFKADMVDIENTMAHMMNSLAEVLRGRIEADDDMDHHLKELEQSLSSAMDNAYAFANNNLSSHAKYYMKYVSFRKMEALILYKAFLYLQKLQTSKAYAGQAATGYSGQLADYIDAAAHSIAIEHPIDEAEAKLAELNNSLDEAELPTTKADLNYFILIHQTKECFDEMADAKKEFIDELSDEEREIYLTTEHR